MGRTMEERVAKLEAMVADVLTNAQIHGKAIQALKKHIRRLEKEREALDGEIRLLKREI